MNILILLISIFVIQGSFALEIGCTHPQVCNLANEMLLRDKAVLLKKMSGDPHHDKLTSSELKKMISIELLLLSPASLQPWTKKIAKLRKKKSIQIPLSPGVKQMYSDYSKHVLAHFWLITDQTTYIADYLSEQFTANHIPHKKIDYDRVKNLYNTRRKISPCFMNSTIVLSHNALLPYVVGMPKSVISIKSSSHHSSITPKKLKALKKKLNASRSKTDKVIWILEKNIHLPTAVKNWIDPKDITVYIDGLGKYGESTSVPLQNLIIQLKQKTCLKN